jgi:hypothetical protein
MIFILRSSVPAKTLNLEAPFIALIIGSKKGNFVKLPKWPGAVFR